MTTPLLWTKSDRGCWEASDGVCDFVIQRIRNCPYAYDVVVVWAGSYDVVHRFESQGGLNLAAAKHELAAWLAQQENGQ